MENKYIYNCGFGFKTLKLDEAKEYCKSNGFQRIQIYNSDNLKFVGLYEYQTRNKTWVLVRA